MSTLTTSSINTFISPICRQFLTTFRTTTYETKFSFLAIRMLRFVLLLTSALVVASVASFGGGDDKFIKKYAMMKVRIETKRNHNVS